MEGERFDGWTKTLAAGHSRRAVVRTLAGSAIAGGLAQLGLREAAACKKKGKKCAKNRQCCSKRCKGGTCRCSKVRKLCSSDSQCCGASTCAPTGCSPDDRCCRPNGESCSLHCDCCSNSGLGSPNQCSDGRCCIGFGQTCRVLGFELDCCPGFFCSEATNKCQL